jgi:hypothetical protein
MSRSRFSLALALTVVFFSGRAALAASPETGEAEIPAEDAGEGEEVLEIVDEEAAQDGEPPEGDTGAVEGVVEAAPEPEGELEAAPEPEGEAARDDAPADPEAIVAGAQPDAAPTHAEAPGEHAGAAGESPVDEAAMPAVQDEAALAQAGLSADGEILDPKLYAEFLRGIVRAKREAVLEKITDKVMEKQLSRMDFVSAIFSIVSLLGIVILFSPLWLAKKYPGKGGVLWKYSALAALLFVLTINLFSGVLGVLRTGQMVAGAATNPQVQIVEATFDVIDEKAEDIAPMGPVIVEPTLAQLEGSSDEPLPVMLLQNVQKFKEDFTIFQSVANFFKGISWIFGYVPIVLSLVTVALFLVGLRPTLTDIVKLPQRAAEGESGVAGRVTKATLRRVGWEFVTTIVIMFLLMFVMISAGLLLAEALNPAIEAFLAYLFVAFLYVQLVPDASSAVVLVGLGGTVLFLVLDLAVVIMASALYIGKSHKIFQRRFQDKEPLRAHGRFWLWGTISLVWALAFPLLYILAAKPAVELLIDKTTAGEEINWALVLTSGPVVLVVAFIGLFVLLRGPRAIGFIAKYRVPKLGRPIGDAMPVRSGMTGPAPTVDAPIAVHADAPDEEAMFGAPVMDEAPHDDFGHVPVRTGATRAYPTVGTGGDAVHKKVRMPTTRYGSVR